MLSGRGRGAQLEKSDRVFALKVLRIEEPKVCSQAPVTPDRK